LCSVGGLIWSVGPIVRASSSKAVLSRWWCGDAGGDVIVAAAQVLHKRVTGGEDLRWPVPLQRIGVVNRCTHR